MLYEVITSLVRTVSATERYLCVINGVGNKLEEVILQFAVLFFLTIYIVQRYSGIYLRVVV